MKMFKGLLPVLLVIFTVLGIGCSSAEKTNVEEVILSELDLLKNLDSDTAMKYISYTELFPDAPENNPLSDKVRNVFSLFFQDFDYKILDIHVDAKKKTATASLKLSTLDAEALARDYCAARLKNEILEAAADSGNTNDFTPSLEERYLLLNDLLTSQKYETVTNKCTIELTDVGEEDSLWEITRTYSLENDLVGGLITYLSDPNILSPEDTLTVYLDTLKNMETDEMCHYLGVSSLLRTEDSDKNTIAAALTEQVHANFDYRILSSSVEGYNASIEVEITTFDSESILASYEKDLDAYLSDLDAVLDGPDVRYQKAYDMLLSHIEANEKNVSSPVTFSLENDGASWKLMDNSAALGTAIFGSLSSTPQDASDKASDSDSSDYEDSDYADSDYTDSDYAEPDYSDSDYTEEDYES